jgi:hypothetical protein
MPKISETDWLESLHIEDNSLTSEILENEREAREEDEGGRMSDKQFKEYRKDGWPLCPQCEEDELYSHLMLGWTDPDSTPSVEECIKGGMTCYRCGWTSPDSLTCEAIKEPPFVRIEV